MGRREPPSGAGGSGVPVHLTRLVGREVVLDELRAALEGTRLLTLTGAPGCGKSRLAAELGRRLAPDVPGGVWWVALAPLDDPALVPRGVSLALDVPEAPDPSTHDGLLDALRARGRVVVVLDNCEHVRDAVADVVRRLVPHCPALHVVTTSRMPLGLPGERVWNVAPLPPAAAVELFVDRATLASSRFRLDPADRPAAEEICRALDGLPLAIELAAPWTRVLSLRQLADRLAGILPAGAVAAAGHPHRDGAARHGTIAAAVHWSYQHLPADARRLLGRLSVFAGGFDLDAAAAIAEPHEDVLDRLRLLVDHSLVEVVEIAGDRAADRREPMRYRLLEPVRQSAARLLPADEADTVRERHARHHIALMLGADPWMLRSTGPPAHRLRAFEREGDNLLAALVWARAVRPDLAVELCVAMAPYWLLVERINEGRAWLDEVLTAGPSDPVLRADALDVAARLAWRQGDYPQARHLFDEALRLSRPSGDVRRIAGGQVGLACVAFAQGDLGEAARLADDGIAAGRAHDDAVILVLALIARGFVHYLEGDVAPGDDRLHEAVERARAIGHWTAVAQAHCCLQHGALLAGDPAAQRSHLVQALDAVRLGGHLDRTDWLWGGVALAMGEDRLHAAHQLIGGAGAMDRHRLTQLPERVAAQAAPLVDRLVRGVPPAAAERLQAEGATLGWDELVAIATAEPPPPVSTGLTPRQHEIAELVAQGRSNVDIAAALSISRRTVETHLENIKTRLGLQSRQELIAWTLPDPPAAHPRPPAGR